MPREATLGFKEFQSRVEEDRYKKMITSPQLLERFLPYSMAFGVEEKWARAFENIYCEWILADSAAVYTV